MEKLLLPHLNTQTNSNLSFSFLTIPQLVDWAEKNKLNCLAIADYFPYEITDFFQACKIKKIKPIWGVKIFLQDQNEEKKYSATIYPQNNKGYKEVLGKLFASDSPSKRTFTKDYILSLLSKKNCLIVLEAYKLEEINYLANQWIFAPTKKEINDNVFIGFNFFLLSPAQSLSSKVISHLLPFFSIKSLTDEETKLLGLWRKTNFHRYFFLSDIQGTYLSYLDTQEYFSRITDDFSFFQLLVIQWQTFLSKINLNPSLRKEKKKKNEDSLLILKSKCWQKLLTLKKEKKEKYSQVLEKELSIIEKLDYVDYFLVFSDAVKYLREKNIIIGPGRGSAVSSLVAYLLEITSIDPLEHNLFFERFLNEKRKALPDIDLDVENQEEIFKYLVEKYPKKQVARIITKKKIGWKNACQEAAKVCKIEEKDLKEILTIIGKVLNQDNLKLQRWKFRYPSFFALIEKIHNLYYDTSIHPAGVVIADSSLVGLVPLTNEKDYLLTLFEEDKLTKLGLKKYDFLSLKETFSFFRQVQEVSSVSSLPSYQEIDLHDKKTWELLNNSFLTGIFQLDTAAARKLFINFRPSSFSELVLFLALNRPGIRKKAEEIIQKKKLNKPLSFRSSLLREILSETYGFIIFEEQLSQILALIYDCSFSEAEIKRREIQKKGLEKDFLTRIQKKFSSIESKIVYQQIVSVRGYTFNKSHAVAYAYLTYYIAYLKINFFSELISCFLNERKEKNLAYLQEAFFFGFQIKKPDINYSQVDWIKKEKNLLMGFSNLRNYRADFFLIVISEREKNGIYKDWEDFLNRTWKNWEKVDINDFQEWIKIGLFRSLKVDAKTLLENSPNIFQYLEIRRKIPLINNKDLSFLFLPISNEMNENKLINNQREYEILGLYISYFSRWEGITKKKDYRLTSLGEIFRQVDEYNNQEISTNIYAIICQIEKKSEDSCVLILQDIRSSFKLSVSGDVYQLNKDKLIVHNELLFTIKIEVKESKINSLVCEKIEEL